MTKQRWAISLLITCHLTALVVASIPDPEGLAVAPPRLTEDGVMRSPITEFLDRSAARMAASVPVIRVVTSPLHVLVDPYMSVGLRQRWNMFSNPMIVDQYVRVDEYVQSRGSSLRVFRELALPAQREDRVRVVHKFRDKAVLNSLEAFVVAVSRRAPSEPLPNDLEPVARYFRNRFRREYLHDDGQVVRTDVWFGQAPMPAVGQRRTAEERESRNATLAAYWDGPAEMPPLFALPDVGAQQREGSIIWRLEYRDQP